MRFRVYEGAVLDPNHLDGLTVVRAVFGWMEKRLKSTVGDGDEV